MLIERATHSIRATLRFVDVLTSQFGRQGGHASPKMNDR